MRDARPARHPLRRQMIERHHVEAGQQHAVERAHRGDESLVACAALSSAAIMASIAFDLTPM